MTGLLAKIRNKFSNTCRAALWVITNSRYQVLLKQLKLTHMLSSGILIKIDSFADWRLYNDIFVDGEYDIAIRAAFKSTKDKLRILDLGANIGFFLKRVLHIRRSEFPNHALELICVEGAPGTFLNLKEALPDLFAQESVELIQGLAGKKSGEALLSINSFHAMTGLSRTSKQRGVKVSFIDLSKATSHWNTIDLFKCDIEGAEQLVFENYPDLLGKSRLAAIEFHLDRVDRDACLSIARANGLIHQTIFHQNEFISVEMHSR